MTQASKRSADNSAGKVRFPSPGGAAATYEITKVGFDDLPSELLGRGLDRPRPGKKGDTHVLSIAGWVVSKGPRPVYVEVLHQGAPLRSAPVAGRRKDVEAQFPDAPKDIPCSFFLPVGLVGMKPASDLVLRVALEDETKVQFARIRVNREPVRSGFDPTVQPIILTGLERSGTTWLMRILATHPRILVDHFPYKHATAKYWLHMFKVLSDPGNRFQSAMPHEFQNNPWWVGNNPFHDDTVLRQPPFAKWFGRKYVEWLAAFCQSSIDDWYTTLARAQRKRSPVYFAEKQNPNFLPVLTRELYPKAKEVFLVRDFRDMACSVLAFDRQRGFSGFGFAGASEEDYIRLGMRQMALDLRRSWRSRGEQSHLVRYEDLAMWPAETLTGMLDYLELDSSPATVRKLVAQVLEPKPQPEERIDNRSDRWMAAEHRTRPDRMASIGRWRSEENGALGAVWEEAFGDVLVEFGYT
jgi:hypothetical protein